MTTKESDLSRTIRFCLKRILNFPIVEISRNKKVQLRGEKTDRKSKIYFCPYRMTTDLSQDVYKMLLLLILKPDYGDQRDSGSRLEIHYSLFCSLPTKHFLNPPTLGKKTTLLSIRRHCYKQYRLGRARTITNHSVLMGSYRPVDIGMRGLWGLY